MFSKQCVRCKEFKGATGFYRGRQSKDGLRCICKQCDGQRIKEYYHHNKEKHRLNVKKRSTRHRTHLTEIVRNIKIRNKCLLCKEDDPVCLDFHHIDPTTKVAPVARLVGSSLSVETVLLEIEKCIVLCANCHRKVTFRSIELDISCPKIILLDEDHQESIYAHKYRQNQERLGFSTLKKDCIPPKEELEKAVWQLPSTQIAKQYGVSDTSVKKWCRKYGIPKPPRGYWAKLRADSSVEAAAVC